MKEPARGFEAYISVVGREVRRADHSFGSLVALLGGLFLGVVVVYMGTAVPEIEEWIRVLVCLGGLGVAATVLALESVARKRRNAAIVEAGRRYLEVVGESVGRFLLSRREAIKERELEKSIAALADAFDAKS